MTMFMTVKQAAEKWGLSDRRVRILCAEGKIPGAFQEGRGWKIPTDAVKPSDGRLKSSESLLDMIDRKKAELDRRRPLTEGEVARLTEEFTVEYTYNADGIRTSKTLMNEFDREYSKSVYLLDGMRIVGETLYGYYDSELLTPKKRKAD